MGILSRARFLAETNFGRDAGWYVELDGATVGELTDVRWADMFWDSYAVSDAPWTHRTLPPTHDSTLWEEGRFRFRNRESGELAHHAFVGGRPPFVREGRVIMRRLYLDPANSLEEVLVELLAIWLRRNR